MFRMSDRKELVRKVLTSFLVFGVLIIPSKVGANRGVKNDLAPLIINLSSPTYFVEEREINMLDFPIGTRIIDILREKEEEKRLKEAEERKRIRLEIMKQTSYAPIDDIRLKEKASDDSKSLNLVLQGKEINFVEEFVDEEDVEWYLVKHGDNTGYIKSKYVGRFGKVKEKTPEERELIARMKLVNTAKELKGKVPYFWGGKSGPGWNSNWGTSRRVTAPGSRSSGTVRPYGLDCSGFVDWAFRTAGYGKVLSGGSGYQWGKSTPIKREELKPGDLAFKQAPNSQGINHVGIYIGDNLFIHCASSKGVVITSASGGSFNYYRRPKVSFK